MYNGDWCPLVALYMCDFLIHLDILQPNTCLVPCNFWTDSWILGCGALTWRWILIKYWWVRWSNYSVLPSTTPVRLRAKKYFCSTTPYYNVLLQYYSSTTPYYNVLLQYYSVLPSTTPVRLRATKYFCSTTPYYNVLLQYYSVLKRTAPVQYYSVLQSTAPVLVCTTKYYSSTTLY